MMAAFALAAFGCAWAQGQAMLHMAGTPTTAPVVAPTTWPKPITLNLGLTPDALDMAHLEKNEMGFTPASVELVEEKPAFVTKEPVYSGKPKYGAFQIGNGPRSITYFAIDEVKGTTGKIYIDLNQNGDLTDDGPGAWGKATEYDGILNYMSTVALHASWGSPVKETESGSYSLMIYKRQGDMRVGYVKVSARSGILTLGGKSYPVLLTENTSDGIFTVPVKGDRTRRPVDLLIDLDGDGTFKGTRQIKDGKTYFLPEQFPLAEPFRLNDQWWIGRPSLSGAELTLVPTVAPGAQVAEAQEPQEEKVLLAAGVPAPDFTAQTPDGKGIRLSDFKGKIVILDFWATWCGPCQASMPGLEKIYKRIGNQGVVVLSVNVFDDKDPFDAWILKHGGKDYTFTFAYDPAGHDTKKSIADSKYGVSGIPTLYVIGRDGKVAAALVGSGNEEKLIGILNAQGIKTKPQ
jgi:thiol-disulfide isomerase/thioredoxin